MSAVDDALNHFRGQVIDAIGDAAPALVEAAQADAQAQVTDLTTQLAAATQQVDALTAQTTQDAATIEADGETITALEAQHSSDTATIGDLQRRIAELEAGQTGQARWVGATLRGTDKSDSVTSPRPTWDITRVYNIGDAVKVDGPVAVSFGSLLGGKGWETNLGKVAALDDALAQLADIPGQRVGDTHEFDNPSKYGTDSVSYLKGAAKFKERVDVANLNREHPLTIFRCCMAYSLSVPARNIDAFYTQDPANYDEFGPDVYKLPDIVKAVDKATQYGKPLCIPEFGPLDNVAHTDPAILDEMQQGIAAWTDATWVAWFDKKGSGADLDQYPNALTFWSAQLS